MENIIIMDAKPTIKTYFQAIDTFLCLKLLRVPPFKVDTDSVPGVAFIFSREDFYATIMIYHDGTLLSEAKVNGEWIDICHGPVKAHRLLYAANQIKRLYDRA